MGPRKLSRESSAHHTYSSLNSRALRSHGTPQKNSSNLRDLIPIERPGYEIPWYTLHSPRRLDQVAIHKRKLHDVHQAFVDSLSGKSNTRLILLTGPSGCSKSTVVELLSDMLVPMFRTSGSDTWKGMDKKNLVNYENDVSIQGTTLSDHFSHFLSQAKYRVRSNLSVIMVEDLPNIFHDETRLKFHNALLDWLYTDDHYVPLLVICLTECMLPDIVQENSDFKSKNMLDSAFTAETIFSKEILNHSRLKRIKFNPINSSLIKKYLGEICIAEKHILKTNGKWDDKAIIIDSLSKCNGDIRSAIASLEYWAKASLINMDIPYARENSKSFFHNLGTILHGSRKLSSEESIDSIIEDSFDTLSDPSFRLGLLENYASFNQGHFSLSYASDIVDSLSESDTMFKSVEGLEYSLRKIRNSFNSLMDEKNNHGAKNFPVEWRVNREIGKFVLEAEELSNVFFYKYDNVISFHHIVFEFGFYAPLILRTKNYKKKSSLYHLKKLQCGKSGVQNKVKQERRRDVEEGVDVLERVGGELKPFISDIAVVNPDEERQIRENSFTSIRARRDERLATLKERKSALDFSLNDDEELLMDPVEDSEDEAGVVSKGRSSVNEPYVDDDEDEDDDDDDDDDELLEYLSQKPHNSDFIPDETLSDSELEYL